MNYTGKYGLVKPIMSDDIIETIQEIGTSMQTIDSELVTVSDGVTVVAPKVEALNEQMYNKVDGLHYHDFSMIVGLIEKLNLIDTKITDLYSKVIAVEPVVVEIVSIDTITDITVPFGTVLSSVLPLTAWVTLSNDTREQRGVKWGSGSLTYDGTTTDEYLFVGDLEGTTIKANVRVIVEAETVPVDPTVIATDTFTRANSTTTLGAPWVIQNDSIWGIKDNRAYLVADGLVGSNIAIIETNKSDCVIEVDCLYDSSLSIYNSGITFRSTDNNNYYQAVTASGALEIRKYVNGIGTLLQSYAFSMVNGVTYNIKVVLSGESITVFLNDTQRLLISDVFNLTATKHGLRSYTSGTALGYWDNFKITTVSTDIIPEIPPSGTTHDVVASGAVANGTTDDSAYFSTTLDNYIQAGKTVALSVAKFRSIATTFIGDGRIKILGMPVSWEVKTLYPQGWVYPKDMTDQILMAMNLPNPSDAIPANAQQKQALSGWYSFPVVKPEVKSLVPWAQLFKKVGSEYPHDSYIAIDNFTIIVYRNSTQKWEILGTSKGGEVPIMGRWYDANFGEDGVDIGNLPAVYTKTTNGIRVKMDNTVGARGFHFWMYDNTKFRFAVVPSDIKFVVTCYDIYAETETGANVLAADVGCDSYSGINGSGSIWELGGGKWINVTTTKKRCYFTTLASNNYNTYCNQGLIDSLV